MAKIHKCQTILKVYKVTPSKYAHFSKKKKRKMSKIGQKLQDYERKLQRMFRFVLVDISYDM